MQRVTVVASTELKKAAFPEYVIEEWMSIDTSEETGGTDQDDLAEFAARACYQSWSKPHAATATNAGHLANLIDKQHFSTMEHAGVTFYIEGVSRSLTHEFVRHRHLSYSQLSQRFVDMSTVSFVVPPAIRDAMLAEDPTLTIEQVEERFNDQDEFHDVRRKYHETVAWLKGLDMPRKKVYQAARAYLPNCTETKLVVTGNHRGWREFLARRLAPNADDEIRELAEKILELLLVEAPNTYQDFKVRSNFNGAHTHTLATAP